jgi:hypothetical protein
MQVITTSSSRASKRRGSKDIWCSGKFSVAVLLEAEEFRERGVEPKQILSAGGTAEAIPGAQMVRGEPYLQGLLDEPGERDYEQE